MFLTCILTTDRYPHHGFLPPPTARDGAAGFWVLLILPLIMVPFAKFRRLFPDVMGCYSFFWVFLFCYEIHIDMYKPKNYNPQIMVYISIYAGLPVR